MESGEAEGMIEHVVVFNVKETEEDCDWDDVQQMMNTLNSLPDSNSELIYLTAGPIVRIRSCSSSSSEETSETEDPKLSHMVHARLHSQSDIAAFTTQLDKLVNPVSDLVLTLTWTPHGLLNGPISPKPGSALRLTLFNLNPAYHDHDHDDDDDVIHHLLQGLNNINHKWKSDSLFQLDQFSYGHTININIPSSSITDSLGLGYNVKLAALVVFHDLNELDACEEYEDEMRSLIHNHNIQPFIHNLIHLDYVLPRPTLSSTPPIP